MNKNSEEDNNQNLVTIYHSVPKSVFLNEEYLRVIGQFGPQVKHILDCPESNLPALSRSQANYLTDKIKQICPLMFPTIDLKDEILSQIKSNEFNGARWLQENLSV